MNSKQITKYLGLLIVVFIFFGSSLQIFAVTDDFVVTTLVGGDTTPPTVPAPFEAIPIATTQINLTWGASTDNFLLSGYHVWRDSIQIATTTNLFYADTGLTANTAYSYYVTAYDSFQNESASSTVISTTTLSVPPSATTTEKTYGTRINRFQNEIKSLVVLPEQDFVVIRYETDNYIKSVIKWGRTASYELGSILENAYTKFHETKISGLIPDTKYQFIIEGENRFGKYGSMYIGEFTTLPSDDIFPPGNVTNLTATKSGNDILLSWVNPDDIDFTKVRIVSSDRFYPNDIADGWVVYEDDGTNTVDEDIALEGLWRYYTVFAYDKKGNISSGSVVKVYLGGDDTEPPSEIDPTLNDIRLQLSDVIFIQDNEVVAVRNNWSVDIDGSKKLSILIPYEKMPEHLKTILVTIEDSHDNNKSFKFLLRINKDKTSYISTLAPLGVDGIFPVRISIFDFKTAQIGYAEGIFNSRIISIQVDKDRDFSFLWKLMRTFTQSYLLLGIILLLILAVAGRRLIHRKW